MPPARDHRTALLSLHAAVLLFGVAGLFGKWLPLSPLWIVFGRAAFAAAALAALLLFRKPVGRAAPAGVPWGLLLPGVVLAVHWVSFFRAIQVSTVAVGLLTFSTFPLFTTLLEPLAFRERLHLRDLLTALLVLAGLAVMVRKPDLRDRVTLGACWGTLSGFTFAVLSLLNRRLVRDESPVRLALGQNAVAAAVLLPLLFVRGVGFGGGMAGPRGWGDVMRLALLGVCCTALAHTLFIHGLSRARAQVASVISALEPVYGIVFALLFLGKEEVPSKWTWAGGVIILSAVVAASFRPPAPPLDVERPQKVPRP